MAKKKEVEEKVDVTVEETEGANELATAVDYNYPDIIRTALLKTDRDGVLWAMIRTKYRNV